jgi:triosephosphate isomerase
MRRPIIAANWKLNKSLKEAQDYARNFGSLANRFRDRDIVLAVPYPFIHAVSKLLEESRIETAAQEIFFEEKGAFTGTVSAAMAKDVGASWALVGHSERRQLFGETLESSAKRMRAALSAGVKPMLCVGETLAEREAGRTADIVGEQIEAALGDLSVESMQDIAIAYEPVWAIGTGKVATPVQAQEVHSEIRERLRYRDQAWAESMRILYGGSVKPANAAELLSQADIDGALVGGASLEPQSFYEIVAAAG